MTDIAFNDSYKVSNKREASEDGMEDCEGPSKRPRSGGRSVDVHFLVQSKNAGAIIGKGGSNINRLRTEFSASVTVPDCPGPERILSVVADVDTLGEILLDVLPKLDDYSHHESMEFDCELRMLLHQSHAGCLIGKGGSRIKELREKTGAQIKIFSNCCPNSTERVVQITGFPSVVVDCVKEVCHVVGQAPIKGPNKQYDPHHFNPMFTNDYGGFEDTGSKGRGRGGSFRGGRPGPPAWRDEVVDNFSFGGGGGDGGAGRGRGGFNAPFGGRGRGLMGQGPNMGNRWNQMGPGAANNTGSAMDRPWTNDNPNFAPRNRFPGSMNGSNTNSFMPQGVDKPPMSQMGGPRPPNMMNVGMGGFQGAGAYQGPTGAPGAMNNPGARFMGPRTPGFVQPVPGTGELFSAKPIGNAHGTSTLRMKIPNDVAGAIIGKGGQRIRKIRRDSAATINIEEATQGSNDRIISITGALNQVQLAQFLMQQSVRENQGGGGGGVGGGRGGGQQRF